MAVLNFKARRNTDGAHDFDPWPRHRGQARARVRRTGRRWVKRADERAWRRDMTAELND